MGSRLKPPMVRLTLLACGLHELGHAAAAAVWGGHVRRLSLTVVGAELRIDYDAPLAYGLSLRSTPASSHKAVSSNVALP